MSGVTFFRSDSAPAPRLKTPAHAPTTKKIEKLTPIPVNTPKTSKYFKLK